MIISGNSSINKVYYSGYTISKIYACGGSLVWEDTPTPVGTYRMKIKKIDNSEVFSNCDGAYSGFSSIDQNEIRGIVGGADIFEAIDSVSSIDFGSCPILSGISFGYGAHTNNTVTSVTFSNTSVSYIGTGCFNYFKALENIVIPDSITSMGDGAFGQSGLRSVTIGSGLTEIPQATFAITPLRNVVIPSGITSVGERAFASCSALTSATVEGSDVELGDKAFNSCSSLRSFDFSNIKKIGSSAFTSATTLSSVTIPSSVTYIGNEVFRGCSNIETATIEPSVTSINRYMFANCTSLSAITLPSSVRTIDEGAFSGCTSLSGFNYDITTYNMNSFKDCTNLTSVNLDSARTIGDYAFNNTKLSTVNMPNVETIGSYVFGSISGLTDVTIGENCLTIGDNAFYSINIPSSTLTITCLAEVPPTISSNLCYIYSLKAIYVPDASVDTYKAANRWSTFQSKIKPISEKP